MTISGNRLQGKMTRVGGKLNQWAHTFQAPLWWALGTGSGWGWESHGMEEYRPSAAKAKTTQAPQRQPPHTKLRPSEEPRPHDRVTSQTHLFNSTIPRPLAEKRGN